MQSFSIEGTKLNYIEENSDKTQTLLFIHGNSHSSKTFYKQFESELFKNYHLIAIDLPGHGESSKEGNYSLKNFAHLIHQFILALDLHDIIVIGHSMGGHVAINLLEHYSPKGLLLFGTPPLKNPFDPNAFLPNPNSTALGQRNSSIPEIETLMTEMKYKGVDMEMAVKDYLRTDPALRTDIFADIINGVHNHEVVLIKSFQGAVIFLLATTESLINNDYIRNEFLGTHKDVLVEIESGHSAHIESSETFNELLADFSNKVFKNTNHFNRLQHESSYEQRN